MRREEEEETPPALTWHIDENRDSPERDMVDPLSED